MTTAVQLARADQIKLFPVDLAFAFDAPDLLTGGLTVYTPTVGDKLFAAWFEITTAWNGTTPRGDFGTFVASTTGLMETMNGPWHMELADYEVGTGLLVGGLANQSAQTPISMCKFTATNPLKICVSQNAHTDGADPGASQGAAIAHLLIAT